MSMNEELFQLGNHVVRLRQEFERDYPHPIFNGQMNQYGTSLSELLELINSLRMAIKREKSQVIDPVETYFMKLKCTYPQMLEITRNVREMGLSCGISMKEKGYD